MAPKIKNSLERTSYKKIQNLNTTEKLLSKYCSKVIFPRA